MNDHILKERETANLVVPISETREAYLTRMEAEEFAGRDFLTPNQIAENAERALTDELICSYIWTNPKTYFEWREQLRQLISWEINLFKHFQEEDRKRNDK